MATQYTAGLSAGNVLTAATMNSIGAAWETWTPTITASSGTFTTVTLGTNRYMRIQKLVIVVFDATVTSIGTATGAMQTTLPVTAKTGGFVDGLAIGTWREKALSGETGVFIWNTTTRAVLVRYDNGAYLTNGDQYGGTFIYEAA